ncbi:MAG: hypothetical protein R2771_15850 [Saprospiraceae bacterium]
MNFEGNTITPTPSGTWSVVVVVSEFFKSISGNYFDPIDMPAGYLCYSISVGKYDVNYCVDTATTTVVVGMLPLLVLQHQVRFVKEHHLIDLFSHLENTDNNGVWIETSVNPSTGSAFDAVNGTFNTINQRQELIHLYIL